MMCPECGKAELRFMESETVETHGLDYGPYERFHDEWWECPSCRACFADKDLEGLS